MHKLGSVSTDAIVIGAGHNGLVCANYLADAGHSVTVVERRTIIGGATVTEELIPGFQCSSCAYVVGLLHPRVLSDLELSRFGLDLYQTDVGDVNLLEDGRSLVLWNELGATLRDLEEALPGESERFVELGLRLERFAGLTSPWILREPPDLSALLAEFEAAGEGELFEEFFTISVADLLDRYLQLDILKGFLAFYGLVSAWGGPWSPGWTFLYGHHSVGEFDGHMGQYGFPRGGMGSVSEALASRARARGVKIRTDAPVRRILVERGRATGVELESGEGIGSGMVLSSADPHRTFIGMLGADDLPPDFRRAIHGFDMRGSMARVHFALDGLPDFVGMEPGAGPHCRGLTLLGGEMERFEYAWESQRRGRIAEDFPVEFIIQSTHDDSLAPEGRHVMMTGVQQLPFDLEVGTWDDHKGEFTERVVDVISRYAPRLRDHMIATHTITPLDLEREYGLTGGNIFHGGMTFGQVFGGRPAMGWSDYRTPVLNLYLCGSGAHPGGGVMGVPGRNAALAAAADMAGVPRPQGDRKPGARRGAMDRLMARPRIRRAMVTLARRPEFARLVDRASRRR